jgi:hypothetical protein
MSDLTPEDRALLDLARGGHEPQAADRGRVRLALAAQLGLAAGLASSSAGAVGGASAASGALSGTALLAVKIVGTVVLTGAVAGAGVAVHRTLRVPSPTPAAAPRALALPPPVPTLATRSAVTDPRPAPAAAVETHPPPKEPLPATPPHPVAMVHAAAPPSASIAASLATAIAADRNGGQTETREGSHASADDAPATAVPTGANDLPSSSPSPTTLRAETALIRAGLDALHGGDPARALALFNEHAREFPGGVLADERDVERITALCGLGRTAEASDAVSLFLGRHPNASLVNRVLASCGGSGSRSIP